ncbi:MAG: hypothetical protein IJV76_11405 [Clostridia bacterium]|nr:hypothetical protein [Clostridia bacterium]
MFGLPGFGRGCPLRGAEEAPLPGRAPFEAFGTFGAVLCPFTGGRCPFGPGAPLFIRARAAASRLRSSSVSGRLGCPCCGAGCLCGTCCAGTFLYVFS